MPTMPKLNWATDSVDILRRGYAQARADIAHECAPDVQISDAEFCTGQGLIFTPHNLRYAEDILYFHGGGWIVGSPKTHITLSSWMAQRSSAFIGGDSAGAALALWGESGSAARGNVAGVICLYGAFGCTEYLDRTSDEYEEDGLSARAVLRMYADLGCADTTRF